MTGAADGLDEADAALLALLRALERRGYTFVTPTPETHARVVSRPCRAAPTARDIFGWSRPFAAGELEPDLRDLLERAGGLERLADERWRSGYRVSTLCGRLLLHSAFPTTERDSVFFGPDSYRFADFIRAELRAGEAFGRLADIGTGSGAGALTAAAHASVGEVVMTDINPRALRLARVNAVHWGVAATQIETDSLDGVEGGFDLVLANPPYIIDPEERAYRHGGDLHGGRLSLEMAEDGLHALNPGGRLLLYTGAAVIEGRTPLCEELAGLAAANGGELSCRELDPDVFGEELARPEYAEVDRIAVIGAVLRRR